MPIMAATTHDVTISVEDSSPVSGLLQLPDDATAMFLLAHGAGAGMRHAFLAAVADQLVARSVGVLRYQFPYMERKSRRTDPPSVCHATVRAAVASAAAAAPSLPLFAGGKSFGGRMTSQAQAARPLPGVEGLAFLGFPLHPPDKPGTARGDHLAAVAIPMLFLQGTRDEFAEPGLIGPLVSKLGPRTTLYPVAHADHSFHVLARSGRKDTEVMTEVVDTLRDWMSRLTSRIGT
jgi:predicted alpha/beta-hydrolase family hydrolase